MRVDEIITKIKFQSNRSESKEEIKRKNLILFLIHKFISTVSQQIIIKTQFLFKFKFNLSY